MANTHYYHGIGDAHLRGKPLGMLQPDVRAAAIGKSAGIRLQLLPPGSGIIENTIVRGATSLTIARVTRVESQSDIELERIGTGQFSPLLLQSPDTAFSQGETVTFDTGGSTQISLTFDAQLTGPAYSQLHLSAEMNTFTPEDTALGTPSDTVFWDPWAKPASRCRVAAGTITGPGGGGPAAVHSFVKGDRINASGGGSFTIVNVPQADGGDFLFAMGRKVGTIAPGNTLTNTRNGALAVITVGAGNVEADVPPGQFGPHHILPNVGGQGTFYEIIPRGDGGGGIGQWQPIVRGAWLLHSSATDVNDRGVRVCPFSTIEATPSDPAAFLYGGITFQTVKCTGSFPSNWTPGETVTGGGGWSGTLWDFDVPNKMLFVYQTNGATLTLSTVSGATSAASATSDGAAYGMMPGSRAWNAWVAQNATIASRSNALFNGQAAKHEGMVLAMWEGELGPYARGCAFPGTVFIADRYRQWIASARAQLGNANMTVALMVFDPRSQFAIVPALAVFLGFALIDVANSTPNVHTYTAEGLRPESVLPLPEPGALLYVRPDDYFTLGQRAWQALRYGQLEVVTGDNFEPLAVFVGIGHSFMGSQIPPQWGFGDLNPDLFPSLSFPTVDTRRLPVLNFHWGHNAWEVYDVAFSANSFLGFTGAFGWEAAMLERMPRRFAVDDELWASIGWIKAHYGGSAINGQVRRAAAAWDPAGTVRDPRVATCNVTALAAGGGQPQRGRFTSTPGTFTGTAWIVGAFVQVAGSLLGQLNGGGNNSALWTNSVVHAIGPDGSWIELAGAFVAEAGTAAGYLVNNGGGYAPGASAVAVDTGTGTVLPGDRFKFGNDAVNVYTVTGAGLPGGGPGSVTFSPTLVNTVPDNTAFTLQPRSFTLTAGPYSLWPEIVRFTKNGIAKCGTQLVRTWNFRGLIVWCAEVDLDLSSDFEAALTRLLTACDGLLHQTNKGEQSPATVIPRLTIKTPWGSDAQRDQIRLAQANVAAARTAAGKPTFLLDTDALAMEYKPGVFPRLTRQDNGVHHTPQAYLDGGYMIDKAFGSMPLIPPHPDGELDAVDIVGAGDSVGLGAGADNSSDQSDVVRGDRVGGADSAGGTDSVAPAAAVAGLEDAMATQPDVASFTLTKDSKTVTRRTLKDMREELEKLRADEARQSGFGDTAVDFNV